MNTKSSYPHPRRELGGTGAGQVMAHYLTLTAVADRQTSGSGFPMPLHNDLHYANRPSLPVKVMVLPQTGIFPVLAAAPPANSKTATKQKTF